MAVQSEIPGTEHKGQDKQLNEMMEGRRKTSKTRKRWQDREVEEGAAIERYMLDKGLTVYVHKTHVPQLIAKINTKSKLILDEYEDPNADGDLEENADIEEAGPSEQRAKRKSAPAEA